ncbi:aminotransferase class V-fold PLP-dependent enzyme [Gemella sp. zg-1178]|uniref:aminotransferase class V-fold PLP-dependent enzyme n=1 Tax=Gemella sp. zg-1178 TaxID=2840372 RepID=UPI001C05660F|nr:SufS family cysteine desulfurase [Gemella sp. zg-1178]MBU0278519.1 SufS family cysteine desulfurase [Gemella sp. zg-1178]
MNIENIRKEFPILNKEINENKIIFFDNAATTQKPKCVVDKIVDFYSNYNSNIHRSVYTLGTEAEDLYYKSKETVRRFINAKYQEEIIYTSGTTESINNLARMLENNIASDDEIIISSIEHHANFIPWQELCNRTGAKLNILEVNENYEIEVEELEKLLTEKTKIVSITYASNVLGNISPVEKIGNLLEDKNIFYIIDAAQAVPHLSVDVQKIKCDFLVFSGHKMLAPTGIGVLYGKKKHLENLAPAKFGGGMISIVEDFSSTWADIPNKYEAGTPLLEQAVGLMAAIDYIEKIGIDNIEKYTKELTKYLYKNLSEIDGITIYGTKNINNRVSLISFNLDSIHPHDIASFLDTKGICVRAGHQCTQPLLNRLNTFSVVRASLYFYNTISEIDIFIQTLKEIKEFFNNELS